MCPVDESSRDSREGRPELYRAYGPGVIVTGSLQSLRNKKAVGPFSRKIISCGEKG